MQKKELLNNRIQDTCFNLSEIKNNVNEVHFYGAGCGTPKTYSNFTKRYWRSVFVNADITMYQKICLAAVYASSAKNKPGIVCILGTGSNSCYFDGVNIKPC